MAKASRRGWWSGTGSTLAVIALCSLTLTGCVSSMSKHSVALAAASAPVVDEARAAYENAEKLHDVRVDFDAVVAFDDTQNVYNPRTILPLLSDKDIQVRLTVLEALQCYVKMLVQITDGTDSASLDAASASVGRSLGNIGNTLAPAFESTFGLSSSGTTTETTVTTTSAQSSSSTTTSGSTAISPAVQNGISTAADALGQFLVAKKIKSELPGIVKNMDPQIEALCELLMKDIAILQDQEKRDYDFIINRQTLFLRQATGANPLNPQQRREQIMKLPEIVRQERRTDAQLTELKASIVRLALTHHALAADAQGNNPASLSQKLGDLSSAGTDLGKFYSSLPTQ